MHVQNGRKKRALIFHEQPANIRRNLRGERNLLVGLPPLMAADLDLHFLVKPLQKIEQLVRREAAEMPIHLVRDIGLRNAQDTGDFALF